MDNPASDSWVVVADEWNCQNDEWGLSWRHCRVAVRFGHVIACHRMTIRISAPRKLIDLIRQNSEPSLRDSDMCLICYILSAAPFAENPAVAITQARWEKEKTWLQYLLHSYSISARWICTSRSFPIQVKMHFPPRAQWRTRRVGTLTSLTVDWYHVCLMCASPYLSTQTRWRRRPIKPQRWLFTE